MLDRTKIRSHIESTFSSVYKTQADGEAVPELKDDSVLLETGLDSLGFAILVAQLEDDLEFDPFTLSSEPYYPVTFGDFVEFYVRNAPK